MGINHITMQRSKAEIELIRDFHVVEKRLAQLHNNPKYASGNNAAAKAEEEARLRDRLAGLGGIHAYQQASLGGLTLGFNSAHWVLEQLVARKSELLTKTKTRKKTMTETETKQGLALLDVGAIKNNYPVKELRCLAPVQVKPTSIDLNPQHEDVVKADFFDYAQQCLAQGRQFDVVVLSLCINFEGDPAKRGEMIRLASKLLPDDGLCFLLLPAPCLENSRYLDLDLLVKILTVVGLEIDGEHKMSDKLFFAVLRKRSGLTQPHETVKRTQCRGGKSRNNFCIIVKPEIAKPTAQKENKKAEDGFVPMSKAARRNKRKKENAKRKREEVASAPSPSNSKSFKSKRRSSKKGGNGK
jgi:25S rRNA (adenine2142-N1)-methyltransferase